MKNLRTNLHVYNLLDAKVSDIDYYFTSRLPGEPLAGVDDIHFHAAIPRTLRLSMIDNLWNYLPRIARTIRVPPARCSGRG
jgi:hypothetical protein